MATTDYQSVAEYLEAQPPATRKALKKVRAILKKALPGAKEAISYQIPVLTLDGTMVVFFGSSGLCVARIEPELRGSES